MVDGLVSQLLENTHHLDTKTTISASTSKNLKTNNMHKFILIIHSNFFLAFHLFYVYIQMIISSRYSGSYYVNKLELRQT